MLSGFKQDTCTRALRERSDPNPSQLVLALSCLVAFCSRGNVNVVNSGLVPIRVVLNSCSCSVDPSFEAMKALSF